MMKDRPYKVMNFSAGQVVNTFIGLGDEVTIPSTEGLVSAFIGLSAPTRESLLGWWKEVCLRKTLRVEMPCKQEFLFRVEEDFPHRSIPCSCGAPDHWVVKYEEAK